MYYALPFLNIWTACKTWHLLFHIVYATSHKRKEIVIMGKIIDYEAELSGGRKVVVNISETSKIGKESSNRLYQYAKWQKKIKK